MVYRALGGVLLIAGVSLAGCATRAVAPAEARSGAVAIEAAGVRAEWAPDIDRCVWFGPSGGANMLHTAHLDEAPAMDGAYTFFGGCYSWVAPQGSPLGWKDFEGREAAWPPDPAMDIGPGRVTSISHNHITTTGPRHRSGLVEHKTLRLDYEYSAELTYTLRNQSDGARVGGTWLNTAVRPEDLVAVRAPEGTELRGWDPLSVERLESILRAPAEGGWSVIDLAGADWQEGIKVYIQSPGDMVRPEIAVWHEGYWFVRSGEPLDSASLERLRSLGEGPVAIYVEPGAGIVEAELYGPIVDIPPGGAVTSTEQWRLISAKRGDLSALPE